MQLQILVSKYKTHIEIGSNLSHFIRYTLLVEGRPVCLYKCISSSLGQIQQCAGNILQRCDSPTQLLQIGWLHIHDTNLPLHHIPNLLYWIEIW